MPRLSPKVCDFIGKYLHGRYFSLCDADDTCVHLLVFPLTGMLLRYFVNFYDMEIIEEEAFLAWKEDVTQEFPGKGKALFQVQNVVVSSQ